MKKNFLAEKEMVFLVLLYFHEYIDSDSKLKYTYVNRITYTWKNTIKRVK